MIQEFCVDRNVTYSGNFKAVYRKSQAGDRIAIATGTFDDVYPHPSGLIGCVNQEDGIGVYINNTFHHKGRNRNQYAFYNNTVERIGAYIEQVTYVNGVEQRKKIYQCGSSTKITPHPNGGLIVENRDKSTQTINLVTKPMLDIPIRWPFSKTERIHSHSSLLRVGEWDECFPYNNGIVFNVGGKFYKEGHEWLTVEKWKDFPWWPFENGIAYLNGSDLIDQQTGDILCSNVSAGNIHSCNNNRIVIEHDNHVFSFYKYDKTGNRQRHEVALNINSYPIFGYQGVIFAEHTTKKQRCYKLLVIK